MDSLYQRLKELDPNTFELLCLHLLTARHPGVGIKHVGGAGGDEGLDLFVGELAAGPVVWQCKAFSQGVRAKQKEQIKESLARAMGKFAPKRWILCLSVDLDSKGHRWCQDLGRRYQNRVEIGIYQASDIVHELLHQHSIREHFFPNASLEVQQLRALIMRTGELTDAELANLSLENVQQYLQRLQDGDARFNYEISFSRDRISDNSRVEPGLVFSASDGQRTIRAFARDREALALSPPKISIAMKASAATKMEEFIRTGRGQEIDAGELISLSTDLPFLSASAPGAKHLQLKLSDSRPPPVQIPLRLTFGSGIGSIVYESLLFTVNRVGTDETEIVARPRNQPFELSVTLRLGESEFTFSEKLEGANVKAVKKFVAAVKALMTTNTVEFYSLGLERSLLKATTSDIQLPPRWTPEFEAFVDQLDALAEFFNVPLRLPTAVTPEDEQTWNLINAIKDDLPLHINEASFEVMKRADNEQQFLESLESDKLAVQLEYKDSQPSLFGVKVPLGTLRLVLSQPQIKNLVQARQDWLTAGEGDAVRIQVTAVEPVKILQS